VTWPGPVSVLPYDQQCCQHNNGITVNIIKGQSHNYHLSSIPCTPNRPSIVNWPIVSIPHSTLPFVLCPSLHLIPCRVFAATCGFVLWSPIFSFYCHSMSSWFPRFWQLLPLLSPLTTTTTVTVTPLPRAFSLWQLVVLSSITTRLPGTYQRSIPRRDKPYPKVLPLMVAEVDSTYPQSYGWYSQ
jgi:hypothetical protein